MTSIRCGSKVIKEEDSIVMAGLLMEQLNCVYMMQVYCDVITIVVWIIAELHVIALF